ncbi:ADP-ribosylglycohydrolase family protein [Salinispora arenicola]|uniref:Hydrolase n=2 Tax=Salinispora arenicola TaxID=168697 RepID=A0A542XU03_SALAC|nr:ADP-ribosylglycohydrolase family protein [Salinispora arenicola]MCN0153935.1 ADP-ribosylglycohydrolase family protein [Salinispora arenicola]MCN0178786.1 ADP-ribosylglycohydrolase family protein [Salinispora arenicola]NIL57285.1 ADP-ribosylglycohydrolase family protein [Salinispora arenicola]NIL61324.1 ADP-ribosylglycohydrolase family protein [Salinispora arenicola]TQL39320.1 ADP-ribosylglycohydrolase [Salinispora arenicola]
MSFTLFADTRLALARDALAGLSVGDALGSQFFVPGCQPTDLATGRLPPPPWAWTDDTEMACSVVAALAGTGRIDPDALALAFAERCEPHRGYGSGAVGILRLIRTGTPWPVAAASAFAGQGSCGNGAAMRVGPLGAYFADSSTRAAAQARASAEVTHAHPEGVAGAVAVAVAASLAARGRLDGHRPEPERLLAGVAAALDPTSEVYRGIRRATGLLGRRPEAAVAALGNGSRVTAQDTVAFTCWVAAGHLDDYPAAVRVCVEAGGDVDTTTAIVGAIVAAHTGVGTPAGVPTEWVDAREPLPDWLP